MLATLLFNAAFLVAGYALRHYIFNDAAVNPTGPAAPTGTRSLFQQILAQAEALAEQELQQLIAAKAAQLQQILSQAAQPAPAK